MERLQQHILHFPLLYAVSRIDHHHAVCHIPCACQIVGDVQVGQFFLLFQLHHQVHDLDSNGYIQHGGGLICYHNGRLYSQRPGNDDPLPLSSRQLIGMLFHEICRRCKTHRFKQLLHLPSDLLFADPGIVKLYSSSYDVADLVGRI